MVFAVLAIGLATRYANAQVVKLPPFFELRVPKTPTIATANGASFLVHELHVTNFTTDTARLTRVEVIDASMPSRVLFAASDTALLGILSRPGNPARDTSRLRLSGGARAVVFMWVPLTNGAPDSIAHRITMAIQRQDSTTTDSLTGARVPVHRPASPIGPPLKGGTWITGNGPDNSTGHRRALIPVNGTPAIAQRFAIDFVMSDAQGRRYEGDPLRNESYFAHGQDAIAVAAGKVVAIKDGIPENVPGITSRAVPITLETVGGNHVVLDIGEGRYAFYAHLQPGSLRVKLGDTVKPGQVLGLVGNSGNSTEPHLHFHIADGIAPLESEGLPYRLESFEVIGTCRNFTDCTRGTAQVRRNEVPLGNVLIAFPD